MIFDNKEYSISPSFVNLFIKNNKENYKHLSQEERLALPWFVEYAGGLRMEKKSSLYKAIKYWQDQYNFDNLEGQGISYVFLSSDPNILVNRLEMLIGEYFVVIKTVYQNQKLFLKN